MEHSARERRAHADRRERRAIRYGEFLSAVQRKKRVVSYNEVYRLEKDGPRAARLRLVDIHRLLTPYVSIRFFEQLRAVLPLAVLLAVFQGIVLDVDIRGAEAITFGILAVMVGLMFFMEGVQQGLMPFAENIGYRLPARFGTAVVLVVAFALGAMATFAEPAIGALQAVDRSLGAKVAPILKLLLDPYVGLLIAAVAASVGLAVAAGMLRSIFGLQLKTLVILTLLPALALTWNVGHDPALAPLLGLAWDCGGITTGPVTVPLVLALGIGVAAAAGRADDPLSGLGVVTLASLFPAIGVMLAGLWLGDNVPLTAVAPAAAASVPWWTLPPLGELLMALRAILPLVLFMLVVQRFVLRESLKQRQAIGYGVLIAIVGMMLFNIGLTTGLVPLGNQAGAAAPIAFALPAPGSGQPLYPFVLGVVLTLLFAFGIGYGATIAEPALNAMGVTVENLTDGAVSRRLLIHAVAAGVGVGAGIGVAKIIFGLPMMCLLLGGYALALALTLMSREDFVNLAWDSAGVTTGPVTVPLIMALGLGLATAVGRGDGFGILAMASVGPIVSVLGLGLWLRFAREMSRIEERRRA